MMIAFRASSPIAATLLLALASLGAAGCSDSGDDASTDTAAQAQVVRNYTANVAANYADALDSAKTLGKAVNVLINTPSDKTLAAARKAWLACRDPYGESEAFRFYQGPIDNDDTTDDIADGPEPLMNSWPLDESYIDYVLDGDKVVNGGIINLPDDFPTIDAEVLAGANAKVSETTISTGYHAIEFLLWGQDHSDTGPGDRPYTDYVTGEDGTAENQDRRAEYLHTTTDLLISNLSDVSAAWADDNKDDYRAAFLAMPAKEALGKMLLGMGSLSGAELSGERMQPAYDNKDQEDEHSCFSDNTAKDLHNNATAIQNVLLGRYGDNDGPGIDDLVEAKNPALAKKLRTQIQDAVDDIDAIVGPFDQAILGDDDTDNRKHISAAIASLHAFTETLVDAAHTLNIDLKFDE
jgi:putative iron-regulated protein